MIHQTAQNFSRKLQLSVSVSQLGVKRLGLGLLFPILLSSCDSGENQNLAKREALLSNPLPTESKSSASAPQAVGEQISTLPATSSAPCLFQGEHPSGESLPDPLPPAPSKDELYSRVVPQDISEIPTSYGIGHLRPVQSYFNYAGSWLPPSLIGSLWLREVVLPLYREPTTETLWGWVACGRLLQKNSDGLSSPLTSERESVTTIEADLQMLETIWGFSAFIVLEEQPGDWYRLQLTTPTSSSNGTFWISGADLGLSPLSITVELWQDFLINRFPLHLLDANVHPLYQAPSTESEVLLEIDAGRLDGPDDLYGLRALEFTGDWVRVQVMKPYIQCPLTETERELRARMESFEGWMLWRTPEQGTRLFYPTRGC
ncbi:MAG: hypothetical protein AAGD25_32150 [Cyanobacteria bacterium P01_F01_bin.150]